MECREHVQCKFHTGCSTFLFCSSSGYSSLVFDKGIFYENPIQVFMEQNRFVKVGLSTDGFLAYVGLDTTRGDIDDFIGGHGGYQNSLLAGKC